MHFFLRRVFLSYYGLYLLFYTPPLSSKTKMEENLRCNIQFFCAFCRLLFCCLISGYLMSSYDILSKVNFSLIKIATNSFPRIVIQCFPFVHTNPGVVQFIMNKSSSRARVAIHSNRIGGWQCPIFILCS